MSNYRWAMLAILALTGCESEPADPLPQRTLTFQAVANGKPVRCGEPIVGLGKDKRTVQLADLRFYIHDVAVIDAGGAVHPLPIETPAGWVLQKQVGGKTQRVALIDFEDGSGECANGSLALNTAVAGPWTGSARGLQFRLGVPESLNHGDALSAPAPLNLTSMFWSWINGYKHLRIDLHTGPAAGWKLHLGATGCDQTPQGTVCTHPNQPLIRLDHFDMATQAVTLDLGALLAQSQLGTEHSGCMSDLDDPLCAPLLHALGLPATATETQVSPQQVFHAAKKL